MRLAFAGKARSGKDTAVDYLLAELPYRSVKLHVADPIYSMARLMLDETKIDNTKPKIRKLLQDIGSAGRDYTENFWVNKLLEEIFKVQHEGYNNIFITGIRYPNEVEALRRSGFRVVYLHRNEDQRITDGASNLEHHSENSLRPEMFPAEDVIYNIGTREEFIQTIKDKLLRV